jgi:lysozyme
MIRGIDVSHHQGAIDWPAVAASGIEFAFVKVSEGGDYIDPRGSENLLGARAAGLRVGAYHYLRPGSGEAQADHFVESYSRADGDLPPVLDLEEEALGASAASVALVWLRCVEDQLGVRPIVYTFPTFARALSFGDHEALAEYPLWIAHWTLRPKPSIPAPWKEWSIWQHSNTGRVPGIRGNVDLNRAVELPP